jgi:sulfatase modifying factor 1
MSPRWLALALAVCTACSIPDLAFHKPGASSGPPPDGASLPAADAPPPGEMASCAQLPATCGANKDESCCTSISLAADTFFRGFDAATDGNGGTRDHPAHVSAFRLDKFEVTVGRFRAFFAAGKGLSSSAPTAGSGAHARAGDGGWNATWTSHLPAKAADLNTQLKCAPFSGTWYDTGDPGYQARVIDPAVDDLRPVGCVSWYEAMAFCIWDGGYLPTEAEWGMAATTPEQRAYPWSQPAGSLTIGTTYLTFSPGGKDTCSIGVDNKCTWADLMPVGSFPMGNGKFGHADLAGNVDEWILDWLNSGDVYPLDPPSHTQCNDCWQDTPSAESDRLTAGGSAPGVPAKQRTSTFSLEAPDDPKFQIGFRCARPN